MTRIAARTPALLIAAHGERSAGADNRSVMALAADLQARGVAAAVEVGFLKGSPSIGDAVTRLADHDALVYPLFLADGFSARTLLRRRLAQAGAFDSGGGRAIRVLAPLGRDPALAELVVRRAREAASQRGFPAFGGDLILLAHGSTVHSASRNAAERMARAIAARRRFARVRTAFLEEPPPLKHVVATTPGFAVIVGLFVSDGLHGGGDALRQIRELRRPDAVFAGNIGGFGDLPDLVASAVKRAQSVPSR